MAELRPHHSDRRYLVQQPRYIDSSDALRDENAEVIANARSDIPRLVTEINRLRELLNEQTTDQS